MISLYFGTLVLAGINWNKRLVGTHLQLIYKCKSCKENHGRRLHNLLLRRIICKTWIKVMKQNLVSHRNHPMTLPVVNGSDVVESEKVVSSISAIWAWIGKTLITHTIIKIRCDVLNWCHDLLVICGSPVILAHWVLPVNSINVYIYIYIIPDFGSIQFWYILTQKGSDEMFKYCRVTLTDIKTVSVITHFNNYHLPLYGCSFMYHWSASTTVSDKIFCFGLPRNLRDTFKYFIGSNPELKLHFVQKY